MRVPVQLAVPVLRRELGDDAEGAWGVWKGASDVGVMAAVFRRGAKGRRQERSAARCRTPGRGEAPVCDCGGAASSRALSSNEFAGGRDGGRKQETTQRME